MEVCRSKKELSHILGKMRNEGQHLGLVPTMGALHRGHTSLLDKAVEENPLAVVSIFVNPTQFNDPSDLRAYPRTPENDLELAETHGAHVVFMPEVQDMYPPGADQHADDHPFEFEGLDQVMEGEHRPGHFMGVAQIVSKLFEVVKPTRAYFGEKDFQQLAIVRQMVRQRDMGVDIRSCPIIRESDGLAMSSRNIRLDEQARAQAPKIFATLVEARKMQATHSPLEIREWVHAQFVAEPGFDLEYFDIVFQKNLKPVSDWAQEGAKIACIAVYLSGIRLIDNLKFA